jgi:hypothetical protein
MYFHGVKTYDQSCDVYFAKLVPIDYPLKQKPIFAIFAKNITRKENMSSTNQLFRLYI